MSVDPIVSVLAKLSARSLREMRTGALATISDLQTQVAWIDRALEDKGKAPEHVDQTTSSPSTPRAVAGRKRGSKRGVIVEIMQADAARSWNPAEIKNELDAREDTETSIESVRVTLRRMAEADEPEVVRTPNGWKLPTVTAAGANGHNPFFEGTQPLSLAGSPQGQDDTES